MVVAQLSRDGCVFCWWEEVWVSKVYFTRDVGCGVLSGKKERVILPVKVMEGVPR
jgi:hypothetical protein